jgi:hypothetical protein
VGQQIPSEPPQHRQRADEAHDIERGEQDPLLAFIEPIEVHSAVAAQARSVIARACSRSAVLLRDPT